MRHVRETGWSVVLLVLGHALSLAGAEPELVVKQGDFVKTLTFSGDLTTESILTVTVPRVSRTSSFAVSFLAPEGSTVKKGDLLVQLDAPDLATERLVLEKQRENARTQIAQKEAELEARYQDLRLSEAIAEGKLKKAALHTQIDASLIPRVDVEKYRFEHQSASIEVDKLKEQVKTFEESRASELAVVRLQFEQADLEFKRLSVELRKLTIRAPGPGLVIHANNPQRVGRFQVGDVAWTGLTLLYLPEMQKPQVRAYVYDEDLPLLKKGMKAEVTFDGLPQRHFEGRIGRLPDMARPRDFGTLLTSFPVDIFLPSSQPGMTLLRPGATARVRVSVVQKNAILVPRSALYQDPGGGASVRKETGPDAPIPARVLDANEEEVSIAADIQPGDLLLKPTSEAPLTREPQVDWILLKRQDLLFSVGGSGHLQAEKAEYITPPLLQDDKEFKISYAVPEGSEVNPGDLLMAFDTSQNETRLREETAELMKAWEEARQAEASLLLQVQELEMLLEEAEAELTRLETKLQQAEQFESGLQVMEARLDSELGRQKVSLLNNKLEAVRRGVELQIKTVKDRVTLHQGRVERQRASIEAMSVESPVSGVVIYSRNRRNERKQVGSEVGGLEQIMELPDLTTLMLNGQVAEVDSDRVKIGQEVEIAIDAIPNQLFRGRVTELGKIFNRVSFDRPGRVLKVKIKLESLDLQQMRPRMAARFQVVLERLQNALVVPLVSIDLSEGDPAVWVKGEKAPERRRIETGVTNQLVAVVVSGLEEGDEVASRPLAGARKEEAAL